MTIRMVKATLTSIAFVFLLLGVFNRPLHGAALQLSISTSKPNFSSDDQIVVTITLKNVSGVPIVIPSIDATNQQLYFGFLVTDSSGASVFTIPPPDDTPEKIATTTVPIQPGQQLMLTLIINKGGVGFFKYLNPSDISSLQEVSGTLNVVGEFVVNSSNRPIGGDPSVFMGTVKSTDTGTTPIQPTIVLKETGDLNADGKVDCADLAIVRASFGKKADQAGFDSRADVNDDGVVDLRDLITVSRKVSPGAVCQ